MFTAPDRALWRGRIDAEDGAAGRRWHQLVEFTAPDTAAVALLGFPCDLGVRSNRGRPGAAAGPDALRQALANQAWHHPLRLWDAGDVAVGEGLAGAQQGYGEALACLLAGQGFAIGLGGGHEIGWAGYLGCRQWLQENDPGKALGILNIDAHFDLRTPAPGPSSGTPFYQVAQDCRQRGVAFHYACLGIARPSNTAALFTRAQDLGVDYLLDTGCRGDNGVQLLERFLARIDYLYLTVCLDAFPASVAPGVSAPAALGIDPRWLLRTLAVLAELLPRHGVHWLLADVAELAPALDSGQRTARLGARIIDEIVATRFASAAGG